MTFVVTKIDASKCVIRVTQLSKLCIHEKDKSKNSHTCKKMVCISMAFSCSNGFKAQTQENIC